MITSLLSPLFSIYLFVVGASYFTTFHVVHLKSEGADEFTIAVLQACYYTGMLAASCYGNRLIGKMGHIHTFSAATVIASGAVLVTGSCTAPWIVALMRVSLGYGMGLAFLAIESWVLISAPLLVRGQLVAFYMMIIYIAYSMGQYMEWLLPSDPSFLFVCSAGLISLAGLPILWGQAPSLSFFKEHSLRQQALTIARSAPFGLIAGFTAGMILGSFYTFGPLFGMAYDLPIPLLMSATIVGGILCQWPIGKLSDTYDRELLLITCSVLLALLASAIAILPHWPLLVLLLSLFLGGFAFTLFPQSIVSIVARTPGVSIVTITAFQCICYSIGCIIGPLTIPLLATHFAAAALYLFIALAATSLAILGILSLQLEQAPLSDTASK